MPCTLGFVRETVRSSRGNTDAPPRGLAFMAKCEARWRDVKHGLLLNNGGRCLSQFWPRCRAALLLLLWGRSGAFCDALPFAVAFHPRIDPSEGSAEFFPNFYLSLFPAKCRSPSRCWGHRHARPCCHFSNRCRYRYRSAYAQASRPYSGFCPSNLLQRSRLDCRSNAV